MKNVLILLSLSMVLSASSQTYVTPIIGYDKTRMFTPLEGYSKAYFGFFVLDEKFNSNSFLFGLKLTQAINRQFSLSLSYQYSKKSEKTYYTPSITNVYDKLAFDNQRFTIMFDYKIIDDWSLDLGIYTNKVSILDLSLSGNFIVEDNLHISEQGIVLSSSYKYKFFEFGAYYFHGFKNQAFNGVNLCLAPLQSFGIYTGVPIEIQRLFGKREQSCPKF